MLNDLIINYNDNGQFMPAIERVPLEILYKAETDRIKISNAAKAAVALMGAGMQFEINEKEEERARFLMDHREYLRESDYANPGIMLKLEALLTQYDREIVQDAAQIRRFVTNRLIEEADPNAKNPAQRLKALELLGKITEVGLFTDQSVITVQQLPTQQIETELRKSLSILLNPEDYSVELTPHTPSPEADADFDALVSSKTK